MTPPSPPSRPGKQMLRVIIESSILGLEVELSQLVTVEKWLKDSPDFIVNRRTDLSKSVASLRAVLSTLDQPPLD